MMVRIQFTKHGAMKFIGHLDTMRYFQRAIRRSGIDIAYSGGFSPHPIMTFAHPLGVGIESDSEIMDIETVTLEMPGEIDLDEPRSTNRERMIDALSAQMSEGFSIRDMRLLPEKTENAMASVAAAAYSVRIPDEFIGLADMEEAVRRINDAEEVMVVKKTKKSEMTLDIKPRIYDLSFNGNRIGMCVDASSAGNIKPELVVSAMYDILGKDKPEMRLQIVRNEIYGRDINGDLKPLIEFGSYF
ncbi:MAG: DUF2344 domain-containing protein [Lachnospiraceae bacterium]|nr:DUF2344 domain-containing protein [Lachnospiraceae bacterium]